MHKAFGFLAPPRQSYTSVPIFSKEMTMIIRTFFVAVVALSVAAISSTQAQTMTKEQLPKAVRSAFEKAYPSATLKAASVEKDGGKTCYELESMDGAQARDIIYAADGTVIEIEESITPTSLPTPVAQALNKRFPNAPLEKAEKLIRGAVVTYEVVITVGKQHNEVIVDEKGKILKVKKA
jgi:uncharacterized membrane protein YkoI